MSPQVTGQPTVATDGFVKSGKEEWRGIEKQAVRQASVKGALAGALMGSLLGSVGSLAGAAALWVGIPAVAAGFLVAGGDSQSPFSVAVPLLASGLAMVGGAIAAVTLGPVAGVLASAGIAGLLGAAIGAVVFGSDAAEEVQAKYRDSPVALQERKLKRAESDRREAEFQAPIQREQARLDGLRQRLRDLQRQDRPSPQQRHEMNSLEAEIHHDEIRLIHGLMVRPERF
ncbi:hypothetical protein IV102_37190 [bacterium]|nr:hypothetical protein [bacterium]